MQFVRLKKMRIRNPEWGIFRDAPEGCFLCPKPDMHGNGDETDYQKT